MVHTHLAVDTPGIAYGGPTLFFTSSPLPPPAMDYAPLLHTPLHLGRMPRPAFRGGLLAFYTSSTAPITPAIFRIEE
jgi:hypothetical protein